jgi:hypothetical protein
MILFWREFLTWVASVIRVMHDAIAEKPSIKVVLNTGFRLHEAPGTFG